MKVLVNFFVCLFLFSLKVSHKSTHPVPEKYLNEGIRYSVDHMVIYLHTSHFHVVNVNVYSNMTYVLLLIFKQNLDKNVFRLRVEHNNYNIPPTYIHISISGLKIAIAIGSFDLSSLLVKL